MYTNRVYFFQRCDIIYIDWIPLGNARRAREEELKRLRKTKGYFSSL
jgi:hypothetical protein